MNKTTKEEKDEIRGMITRLCIAYDVERKDLPEIFGVGAKSINNWVHYGRRPYEQMRECHLKTGVSLDWLVFGDKSKKPELSLNDLDELVSIMSNVIKGAVEYKTISFRYEDSQSNILDKLKNDLTKWYKIRAGSPEPNGSNKTD